MAHVEFNPEDFYLPADFGRHEATWITWPHDDTIPGYQLKHEATWLQLTAALHEHEKVRLIVQDKRRRDHLEHQLKFHGIGLENIEFFTIPTNDLWICDNGPLVVVNKKGQRAVVTWRFNGWGGRYPHDLDNQVARKAADMLSLPIINAPLTLESGFEVNGKGTLLATRASIINSNRNPGMAQGEIEKILGKHIGVTNFIWLTGVDGNDPELGPEETDCHVDLCVRFVNEDTVVYGWPDEFDEQDPFYRRVLKVHLGELENARTESGKRLTIVHCPMPRYPMYSTSRVGAVQHIQKMGRARLGACGPTLWYCGYLDWHVANGVVLVPIFGDENDDRALKIIGEQFPGREIVGIDCRALFEGGGLIHCVTKAQAAVPE